MEGSGRGEVRRGHPRSTGCLNAVPEGEGERRGEGGR